MTVQIKLLILNIMLLLEPIGDGPVSLPARLYLQLLLENRFRNSSSRIILEIWNLFEDNSNPYLTTLSETFDLGVNVANLQ